MRQRQHKKTTGSTRQASSTSHTGIFSWLALNVHTLLTSLTSLIFLAFWRLRQNWNLLLLIGIGMIVSVTLVCVIPLYTLVATSAGVRGAFANNPTQQYITINGSGEPGFSLSSSQQFKGELDQLFQQYLGSNVNHNPQFLAQTAFSPLANPHLPDTTNINYAVGLNSYDMQAVRPHIQLIQGRLPESNTNDIEIILTPDEAATLHIHVGDVLTTQLGYAYVQFSPSTSTVQPPPLPQSLSFRLVGLFNVNSASDLFWHGNFFQSAGTFGTPEIISVQAIVSTSAMFHVLDTINSLALQQNQVLGNEIEVSWAYQLNVSHLNSDQLGSVLTGLNKFNNAINSTMQTDPLVRNLKASTPSNFTSTYLQRIITERIPLIILTFVTTGLLLLFTILMSNLLVDRQTEMIAVLRSRGASQRQIFSAFSLQGLLLGIVALLIGPLLAPALARFLTQVLFRGKEYGTLGLIANTAEAAFSTRWYALAAALLVVGAMIFSLYQALQLDILHLRRDTARMRRRSLLQRLHWDVATLLIAVIIYGASLYIASTGVLDPQLSVSWLGPLTFAASLAAILAGAFLCLRLFPRFLQLATRMALHAQGAAPLLALAQMARAPRHVLRLMLLLLMATAFATFALVFVASQEQRIPDIATYQAGADISGVISYVNPSKRLSVADLTTAYRRVPGVLSACIGYTASEGYSTATGSIAIMMQAADADTYAQSALWADPDASSLNSLMTQLRTRRTDVLTQHAIPTIVDSATWNALNLSIGSHFTLGDAHGSLPYVVIAQVEHIPTISDNADGSNGGGLIVDYQSYATLFAATSHDQLPFLNTVWLHTSASADAQVVAALSQGPLQLTPLYDRRAIIGTLRSDPLYLTMLGVLLIGSVLPLILALVGNLFASWQNTNVRQIDFAVLRALGSAPHQVAQTLAWEQVGGYVIAIGVGVIAGIILSFMAVPVLVFTGVAPGGLGSETSGNAFFLLQSVPPIQVILPFSLALIVLLLLAFCAFTLSIVIRRVLQASLTQMLRLNVD